jgi:molecular chaperone Hsp33
MTGLSSPPPEDRVQAFQIETAPHRGRLVRLGPVLDQCLERHAYPAPVARVLGETMVLAAALAATLKCDGIFTLQLKGAGPVTLVVADVLSDFDEETHERQIRGYARFDEAALANSVEANRDEAPLAALLGEGWLAFTVDQGPDTERYQGIVALAGDTLAECVTHYFRQSEQLPTGLRLAVARSPEAWRGAALLLQRMPGSGGNGTDSYGGDHHNENQPEDDGQEAWRRAMILMATLTPTELLDPTLNDHDLLYRLFHQDGVRVFSPEAIHAGCRCSRDRVATVLRSLGRAEVDASQQNGIVEVVCEFCSTHYGFDQEQVAGLFSQAGPLVESSSGL